MLASVIVTVIWSLIGKHPPLFEVVRVRITLPAAVSAELGMYEALRAVAVGVKVPVPEVVHVPLPVEEVPLRETTLLFAHTVASLPASTVGRGVKKTVTLSSSELHAPLFAEVNINVTLPPVISPAPGTYVAFKVVAVGVNVPVPKVVHVPLREMRRDQIS